ncbi:hypothetical protein AAMO2058_000086100 [Amorphochlora amoebiformis]
MASLCRRLGTSSRLRGSLRLAVLIFIVMLHFKLFTFTGTLCHSSLDAVTDLPHVPVHHSMPSNDNFQCFLRPARQPVLFRPCSSSSPLPLSSPQPLFSTKSTWKNVLGRFANYTWLSSAAEADARVAVIVGPPRSCTMNGTSSPILFLNGLEEDRLQASLPFSSFVDAARAREAGESHFSEQAFDGRVFYLAQCPLYDGSYNAESPTSVKNFTATRGSGGVLRGLLSARDFPEFIGNQRVVSAHLWLGIDPTATNPHYDSHDNLLCVARGEKTVILFPPSPQSLRLLRPRPPSSRDPNHSPMSPKSFHRILNSTRAAKAGAMVAVVAPGDSLLIPEGWWHQVTSKALTSAINLFLPSSLLPPPQALEIEQNQFEIAYPIRSLLSRLAPRAALRRFKRLYPGRGTKDYILESSGCVSDVKRIKKSIISLSSPLKLLKPPTYDKSALSKALETASPAVAYALLLRCRAPTPGEEGSKEFQDGPDVFDALVDCVEGGEQKQRRVVRRLFRQRDRFVSKALSLEIMRVHGVGIRECPRSSIFGQDLRSEVKRVHY